MFYLLLMALALVERLAVDLGPNIELVTMASVLAGAYGRGWWRYGVPLVIMGISDLYLGWGAISLFTWSGFLLMGVWPRLWHKVGLTRPLAALGGGLTGSLWFYLWTNLGVFLTDSFMMYSKTSAGLLTCMINGLPFLRLQLTSTLVFVPLGVVMVEGYRWWKRGILTRMVWDLRTKFMS